MKRIDWLKRYYSALLEDFQNQNENGAELSVVDFVAADPSTNKRYASWLIKTYLAEGFRSEDLSKATETLEHFMQHQHRLDIAQRDINRFSTLSDVWIAVAPFIEIPDEGLSVSGKEQKRRDKALAYEQSIILVDDQDFIAAAPLTEFASKWWGKGTRWCTAADKDNAFDQYHQKAPLIIFVFPDGRKMQMYVTDDDFQFMDENDAPVHDEAILERWDLLESFMQWAITKNGGVLEKFPDQRRTFELCTEAVKKTGMALYYVPKQHLNFDLCLEAVRKSGRALDYVPAKHLTSDLCLEAVKQSGGALCYVPEQHRTFDLCLEAVKQNGSALFYIPAKHRTFDLCLEAVRQDGGALNYVPDQHRTFDLCVDALRQSGKALYFVPEKYRTFDLCIEAVRRYGVALCYVPDQHRTFDLCIEAVKQSGKALCYVPDHNRTFELCMEAVRQSGLALQHVPEQYQTFDLCVEAVRQSGGTLEYVPDNIRNEISHTIDNINISPAWLQNDFYFDNIKQKMSGNVVSENTEPKFTAFSCMSAKS